jgi:predicted transcriptional regulator
MCRENQWVFPLKDNSNSPCNLNQLCLSYCAYRKSMAYAKKVEFEDAAHILDEEDEATRAILKQRIKSADEGRLVTAEEARRRMKKWLTKSSTPKTR